MLNKSGQKFTVSKKFQAADGDEEDVEIIRTLRTAKRPNSCILNHQIINIINLVCISFGKNDK